MAVIALDLGGTKLSGAVFRSNGKMVSGSVVPLEGRQGRAVGALIRREITDLLETARARRIKVGAIGVAVPGVTDPRTGLVWAPNIPGWKNYALRREIRRALRDWHPQRLTEHGTRNTKQAPRLPVCLESDRSCYILGETWRGAAKGCRDAIFLAVGTGIGAGILINGEILRGARGVAGAIGWLALERPLRREYAGCGCFEHHASGAGLAKIANELLLHRSNRSTRLKSHHSSAPALHSSNSLTAQDVFAAYKRGDPVAKKTLAQAVQFWGMAVANLVSLFNPEKIVFGGGVFGPATQFLDEIQTEARKWAQPIAFKQVKLQASRLGGDAGLYGAAYLALQSLSRKP